MNQILTGRKQIQKFVGRAWSVIRKWIDHDDFPAAKIEGVWESDVDMILEWRRTKINSRKTPCQ